MTADSMSAPASMWIAMPEMKPPRFATLTLVALTTVAAVVAVGPAAKMIALLFSSTVLATPTFPTSQPARVNGTHGAGVLRTEPVPPSDTGSLLTMLKFESPDGVGGVVAGFPPSVRSVQYLNEDENPVVPFGRKKL